MMGIRLKLIVVGLAATTVLPMPTAAAAKYPSTVDVSPVSWLCAGIGTLGFGSNRYVVEANGAYRRGKYTYNRDTGKVNFTTGFMDKRYGKLTDYSKWTGWTLEIRKKSNKGYVTSCGTSTISF